MIPVTSQSNTVTLLQGEDDVTISRDDTVVSENLDDANEQDTLSSQPVLDKKRSSQINRGSSHVSSTVSVRQDIESNHAEVESNFLVQCIYKNNLALLREFFEKESDHGKKEVINSLHERDANGKLPLDTASCLGRTELIQFLIENGADVNIPSSKGYTSLHYCAAWGHKTTLKLLVDKGGNFQLRNVYNERPREVAHRYNQTECVYYLDWAEAKVNLEKAVASAQEIISEYVDKNAAVKLTKEEKFIVITTCKEKQEWMDKNKEASIADYQAHLTSFSNIVNPILNKINEQVAQKDILILQTKNKL